VCALAKRARPAFSASLCLTSHWSPTGEAPAAAGTPDRTSTTNSRGTVHDRDTATVGTGLNNRDINNDGEVIISRAVTINRDPTNSKDAINITE
jgi:hypothetical protein